MTFGPPRGMRDFYPEEMRIRNKIFTAWRQAAQMYGFEEYDAPVVETEELLTRKGGEEIVQQIYNFTDKSDRRLALRPEMTPSLARMVIAKQKQLTYPLKWFCTPQCFRYERMTKGRKREHYQWNLDIVGPESLLAEAEVLGTAITALKILGLDESHYRVRLGSRALLAELFSKSGLADEHFMPVCLVLDKMGKISEEEIRKLLTEEKLVDAEIDKVLELMQISNIDDAARYLGGSSPNVDAVQELLRIMTAANMAQYIEFDISIIRGLSYYTGMVFEAFDTQGKFRAIFGGGRYNNLLSSLGGETMPCVGLGFGDVVVTELLLALNKLDDVNQSGNIIIGYMTPAEQQFALRVATLLRSHNNEVNLALEPEKAKKLFSRANKISAQNVIYIGPSEAEQQTVNIKNMSSGEQQTVSLAQLEKGEFTIV